MVMIIFIYSTQRIIKDTLVVSGLGAELISTMKLWGITPSAIIVMLLYAKLSDRFDKTFIFHLFNSMFVGYFLIFTILISPNIDYFKLDLGYIKNSLPYLRYPVIMVENWSYTFYYILAELWGSVMLSLMFWQTANQVFKINQAKRLYPLFALIGQLGMIMSNLTVSFSTNKSLVHSWQESLVYINLSVTVGGIILSALYFYLTNYLVDRNIINAETVKKGRKKVSFFDGIKHVLSSRYIALITLLIICYGASINLVEGIWKAQARAAYPDRQSYAAFMANIQLYTAVVSAVAMIFGSYIMNKISWRSAAIITPVTIFITGILFFTFTIFQSKISPLPVSLSPLMLAVLFGSFQNVGSKGVKYAFFDSTKEIAYIPLDETLKSKGKAAADVVGGRFGKSGGALITFILLLSPGADLISISPVLFGFFLIIICIWFISVHFLSKEFQIKASNSQDKV